MDPNHWPELLWLLVALGFASVVVSILLLLWNAVFRRRKPGWFADSALLGCSGLALVVLMMVFIMISPGRLTQEWQRTLGTLIVAAVGLALAWLSTRFFRRNSSFDRRRRFGSAKGEFTVPDDFNDPLPEDIEGEFYKVVAKSQS